jgi:hypothetical protein
VAAVARVAQQQITPVFPPHFRHYGGASRVSRRFLRHKIRRVAALPVLPARLRFSARLQYGEFLAHSALNFSNPAIG